MKKFAQHVARRTSRLTRSASGAESGLESGDLEDDDEVRDAADATDEDGSGADEDRKSGDEDGEDDDDGDEEDFLDTDLDARDKLRAVLKEIAEGAAEVSLAMTRIGPTGVKALAKSIVKSTTLTSLDLEQSYIGKEGAAMLAGALRQSHSLQRLRLSRNDLGDDGVIALSKMLSENTSLRELDLSSNNVHDAGITGFAEAMAKNSTLAVLKLRWNYIYDAGAQALATAVAESALTELDAYDNEFSSHGAAALAKAAGECATLEALNIGNNRIEAAGIEALAEAVMSSSTLSSLSIDAAGIDDDRVKILAAAVARSSSLATLSLFDNRIQAEGASALADAVKGCRTLKTLSLGDNRIGDEGVVPLAAAIEASSLTTLKLNSNSIRDSGAQSLAKVVPFLETLDLSDNSIGDPGAKSLASGVSKSTALRTLSLEDNSIGDAAIESLAAAIGKSRSLETVDLGSNKIGDKGAKALAKAWGKCPTLKTLRLSSNNIGSAGGEALAAAVSALGTPVTLTYTYNDLGAKASVNLATAVAIANAEISLSLNSEDIDDDTAVALAAKLATMTTLAKLDLDDNKIGDRGAQALAGAFAQLSLEKLEIRSNKFGEAGVIAIVESLAESEALKELELSGNNVGDHGAEALATTLGRKLASIDLRNCQIGEAGANALADGVLADSDTQVTKLVLVGNPIGDEGAQALGAALKVNSALKALDMQDTEIGDRGAEALASGLRVNTALEKLDLQTNKIGDAGAEALADAIAENTVLEMLDVYDNSIGDAGAAALAFALSRRSTRIELDYRSNNISPKGVCLLLAAEAKNSSSTELSLSDRDMSDETLTELVGMLAQNDTLRSLSLRNNQFTPRGIEALSSLLAEQHTLTELNLGGNHVGDAGAASLAQALALNKGLEKIDLEDIGLSDVGAIALAQGLESNRTLATLELEENHISDEGAAALVLAADVTRTLKKLSLNENKIGEATESEAAKKKSQDAKPRLSLGDGGDGGDKRTAAELPNESSAVTPAARDKEGAGNVAALAGALAKNRTITTLSLDENNLGDAGAEQLMAGLARNTTLTSLSISECEIGVTGALLVANMLTENHDLVELDLSGNDIGDEGAEALANSLSRNEALQQLDLDNIDFGPRAHEALARSLGESRALTKLNAGLPRFSNDLSWPGLWSRKTPGGSESDGAEYSPIPIEERVKLIREHLLDSDEDKWTVEAHALARDHANIFAAFCAILQQHDPKAAPFHDHRLWLQEDEKAKQSDALPIILVLLDCRENRTYKLSEEFCEEVLSGCLPLSEGLQLMRAEDSSGRSIRSLALANTNTKEWAKTFGTYLGRYSIADGPPVHESKTCAVHFATDVRGMNRPVAIKIMRDPVQYNREIDTRAGADLQGCLELLWPEDESERRKQEKDLCLVMPRGSRSLFEAINTERFAGRDLKKISAISWKIALALRGLHESQRIHGDIKPRNVVRTSASASFTFEDNRHGGLQVSVDWAASSTGAGLVREEETWQLIDMDASVSIGGKVSEKVSTGYAAPEVARWHFVDGANPERQPDATAAMDVWGFGVLLYQMLSGTKLFMVDESDDNLVHSRDKMELVNWLALDDERLERIRQHSSHDNTDGLDATEAYMIEEARDLVRLCLRGTPDERICLEEILLHPFFADFAEAEGIFDVGSVASDALDLVPSAASSEKLSRKVRETGHDKGRFVKSRIASLHHCIKGLEQRFSMIRRSINPPPPKGTSWYQDPSIRDDLVDLPKFHFFLSHMQKQAAGIVKDLASGLERNQMRSWIDMRAPEITLETMQRGVLSSQCFVMVLTTDVLFRPFCLAELKFAVDHFGDALEQHVFFLVEEDDRFSPWRAGEDEPWTPCFEPWRPGASAPQLEDLQLDETDLGAAKLAALQLDEKGRKLREKALKLRRRGGDFLKLQEKAETEKKAVLQGLAVEARESGDRDLEDTCTIRAERASRKAKQSRSELQRRRLVEDLEKSFGLPEDYFRAARRALETCVRIPYRRRQYEEDAMLHTLAVHAGFAPLPPPEDVKGASSLPKMCIVGAKNSQVVVQLRASLLRGAVKSQLHEAEVLVVVLEPGCLGDVEDALIRANQAGREARYLAVEHNWVFGSHEGYAFKKESAKLLDKLFDHLEVLAWRPAKEGDPTYEEPMPNYVTYHENKALIAELRLRAQRLATTGSRDE